jgi:AraC family transcriptional regulator
LACAGAAAGFADQSHFTKVFRRIVGVTPMRFRGKIGRGHNHAEALAASFKNEDQLTLGAQKGP